MRSDFGVKLRGSQRAVLYSGKHTGLAVLTKQAVGILQTELHESVNAVLTADIHDDPAEVKQKILYHILMILTAKLAKIPPSADKNASRRNIFCHIFIMFVTRFFIRLFL